MSGLSKVLLLPQCKLGWTVVSGDRPLVDEALARLELVADTFLSVATPVQLALPRLLEQAPAVKRAILSRLRANVAALDQSLAELGPQCPIRRLPIHGGWYAVLEVPRTHDDDAWVELLVREEGVIVHPGYFFDFDREGFLVVSLLPAPSAFRDGIARALRRLAT
jgi:aspartate/methionine/tyrosine aminotransferase